MFFLITVISTALTIIFLKSKINSKKNDDEQFMRNMAHSPNRRTGSEIARFEKIRAQKVGSKKFIWHSAGDEGCCNACSKNNGKTFKWDKPPDTGLPGEGKLCLNGKCRCWAEAIIPPPKK